MPDMWVDTDKSKETREARPNAPTIVAAITASTREERMTPGSDDKPSEANRTLAHALFAIMERWSDDHESVYRESDQAREFALGRHYGYDSAALGLRVISPQPTPNVIRLTLNYIDGWVERVVAAILAQPPIIKCLAGDSDVVDQAASEGADDVVEWRQLCGELAADPENVARNACVDGICWVHEEWDSTAGPTVHTGQWDVFHPETGELLDQPQKQMAAQGAFHREILVIRQGVPDPTATHPFRGSGFFVRKRISRFDFENLFGEEVSEDTEPSVDERTSRVANMGRGTTASASTMFSGNDPSARDELEIVTLYVPKCADYPKGCRIVFTQDRVVEDVDNPRYPTDEEMAQGEPEPNPCEEPPWPVFPFVDKNRPQSPFGTSRVHKAIQCNKGINAVASRSVMQVGQLGAPKVLVPNDLAQEWSDQIQVFKLPKTHFGRYEPKILVPPQMSAENIRLWQEFRQAGMEFMGLNDPAIGQDQGHEDSGYKTRLQQQAAMGSVEQFRKRCNDMWACIYRYDVFLFRRYADTKFKLAVGGENQQAALKALDKTVLMANTHVRCVHDSAIPRDPQQLMTWTMQFLKTGVMQLPPDQKEEMFQLMRLRDFKSLYQRKAGDRMRAQRQILRIKEGRDPGEISDVDDHLVQAAVLSEYILSEEFETAVENETTAATQPGAPPPVQGQSMSPTYDRAMKLWQKHKQALLAQAQAQAPPVQVKITGTATQPETDKLLGQPAPAAPGGGAQAAAPPQAAAA